MVHEAKSTIYHCAINVYGILMSFILNKHITIFTDNDMYHANVATLGNRSPILNERIDNSFIIPDYPARSPFYVLSYIICRSFSQIYDFAIYKLPVFPGCYFLSSCHHFINRQWLAVRLYHHIFMCSDNRPL